MSAEPNNSSMWLEGKTSRRDRLRFLSETVNETARIARVNVSLVLIAALYLALTLLSATDENLLRNSIVTLPQLQTGISLKLSYIFAPIVFLYLHVQTLFLLIVLAQKVKRFQTVLDDETTNATDKEKAECRDWLSAFSFVQVHGSTGAFAWFTRILVWLGISAIPLTLFFLIDLSFMRFQSLGISVIHHVCFLADLVAVYWFNRQAVPDRLQFRWRYLRELFRPNGGSWVSGERMRKLGIISWVTLKTVIVTLLLIYAWPPEYESNSSDAKEYWYDDEIIGFNIFDDVLCPESPWRGVCRYLNVSGKTLTRFGSDWEAAVAPKKFEGDEAEQYRRRFGLDLEQRSLRFAVFEGAWIPAIKLTRADLRGAKFISVRANGADLRYAEMNGADLSDAEMNGADLRYAKMYDADLSDAKMNDTVLHFAEMNGAELIETKMNGADLSKAKINGADLSYAKINDAILYSAELNDTDLYFAKMNRADLSDAKMNGADLSYAEMNDADLSDAEMNGADLSDAGMNGADLSFAEMNGADLSDAEMNGTNLDFAYVAGAHGLPLIDDETALYFTYWKLPDLRDGTGSHQERVEEYLEHLPTGLQLRWKPEISLKDHLLHYMNLGQLKPVWLP